jgi:hypothetical protein
MELRGRVYEFDPVRWQIPAARIYFDVATLLRQMSSRQPQVLQELLMSWFAARTMSESRSFTLMPPPRA